MHRAVLLPMCVLFLSTPLAARILPVGPGGYASLELAARDARPGDTIRFSAGVHNGGSYIEGLRGSPDAWITILGDSAGVTTIRGGTNAIQLTDPAWLRIAHLRFEQQTGNGLNIDDGGSYDSPAHRLVIEHCTWAGIAVSGNNDLLKMSGVDTFLVRNCTFLDGAAGGSMIDMVGCHEGWIEANRFENGGSNSIQAKGGSSRIGIVRNAFFRGGQRAINIGGSTGLTFFRPLSATWEAAEILIHANIFTGAVAPIAYVGAVQCAVINNTIYLPEKWVIRILQETTDPRFLQCGENIFQNNLVVIDNRAATPSVNIGSNTRPQTFLFSTNLWFNSENGSWTGPNVPTPDAGGIVGSDPLLAAPGMSGGDFSLRSLSPAIGAGTPITDPVLDFTGRPFRQQRSIGALEVSVPSSVARVASAPAFDIDVHPQPARDVLLVTLHDGNGDGLQGWEGGMSRAVPSGDLLDVTGRRVASLRFDAGSVTGRLDLTAVPPGAYLLHVVRNGSSAVRPVLVVR